MSLRSLFRDVFMPAPTKAFIDEDNNLFSPTGQLVGSYTRKRDAVRGAKRRGFEVEA